MLKALPCKTALALAACSVVDAVAFRQHFHELAGD
jgi:hypothetical protein